MWGIGSDLTAQGLDFQLEPNCGPNPPPDYHLGINIARFSSWILHVTG